MKLFHRFFIFLIGMISLTVVASTPHLEQKQKPTFEFVQSVEYHKVANVQTEAIAFESQADQGEQVFLYQKQDAVTDVFQNVVSDDDVGWQSKSYEWKELPNGEERNNVINTAKATMGKTDCETCRAKCSTTSNLGGGSFVVQCNNGRIYVATYCESSGWHVSDQTYNLSQGHLPVPYPC